MKLSAHNGHTFMALSGAVVAALTLATTAVGDLHVVVTASPSPAKQQETLDVEIVVANDGAFAVNNVSVVLDYPTGLQSLSNSLFDGSCPGTSCSAGQAATFNIGTLPAGKAVTLDMPLRVAAGTENGTVIPLDVNVFASGNLEASTSTNITVDGTRLLELALIEDADPVVPGGELTYTMTFGVLSASPGSPNATLSMPLPSGTAFVAASDGGTESGGMVEWSLGNLNPGTSGKRTVTVQVDQGAANGSILTAKATFEDAAGNHVSYESATRVQQPIPLQLVVTASPNPTRIVHTLDMELTVTNDGPFDRTGVVLRLRRPDGMESLSNSLFDGACPGISCDVQQKAVFNIGTLPAGKGRTFSMPWRVASGVSDGRVISFKAEVSDSTGDLRESGASISVQHPNRLGLVMVVDHDPVEPGESLTYTLNYGVPAANPGSAGATLRVTLPPGTSFVSASDGGTLVGNDVEWSLGNINPGESGQRRLTVLVDSNAVMGSILTSEATFGDASGNLVIYRSGTMIQAEHPLQLAVIASPDPARPNETLDMEVTVTNDGPFDRTGVVLRVRRPDHLVALSNSLFFGGSCPGISCGIQQEAVFTIGTVPAGQGVTYSMPWRVASGVPDGTVLSFKAEVSDAPGDRRYSGANLAVLAARPLDVALVEITEPIVPGDELQYRVTYGALGHSGGANDGVVRLELPEGVTFQSATGGGSLVGSAVEWSVGSINPGAGGERSVTTVVDPGVTLGSILRSSIVFRDASGNEVRFGETTRVQAAPPLVVALNANPNPVAAGTSVNLNLSVTNTSPFSLNDVVLRLEYPDGLNSLSNSAFPGTCPGISCSAQQTAIFTVGQLAAGESVCYIISPTVSGSTPNGTVINFDAWGFESTGFQGSAGFAVMVGSVFEGPKVGDLTGNENVGVADLLLLLGAWGACPDPCNCPPDLDGDGTVGVSDLLILLSNWG